MKTATAEWVEKAEGDFATAGREFRAAPSPNFDAACFRAQQCAEKYLKACLIEAGTSFPKTHDLSALIELLSSASEWLACGPTWIGLPTWASKCAILARRPTPRMLHGLSTSPGGLGPRRDDSWPSYRNP
jgi:hypothetical protein